MGPLLLLLMLPPLLLLLPLLLTLLPLLLLAMPELLPLLPTDMPELSLPLPTDMLLTNFRMLSSLVIPTKTRLYKVHLSEWSSVWHLSAKTKSDNEKIF